MKKVIIIEFNDFHEEVILPQIQYLKANNIDIHLFINEEIEKKKKIYFNDCSVTLIKSKNIFIKFLYVIYLIFYLKLKNIDIIIYNTLESIYITLIDFFLIGKIKRIGIVHNISFLQKKSLKLKNIFVLSENILININSEMLKTYNFYCFYPLIFLNKQIKNIKKNSNIIKIVIPGLVEFSRRDYIGLIQLLSKIKLKSNVKFYILGNITKLDGPYVQKEIIKNKLEQIFVVYDKFVEYDEYFGVINDSDLIMPLIHPRVKNFEKYHKSKITAAFTMAFSFKKPLFLYESLAELKEFKNFSIPYNLNNFENIINNLEKHKINKVVKKIVEEQKFLFDYQSQHYMEILINLK